jgi:hypothetical protein
VYTTLIGALCAGGAIADSRGRQRPAWHIGLDIVAGGFLVLLMVGHWHGRVVAPMGRMAAWLFALMLVWDIYSTSCDLADAKEDPELSASENAWVERAGIVTAAVLLAPAYALALTSVVMAWEIA